MQQFVALPQVASCMRRAKVLFAVCAATGKWYHVVNMDLARQRVPAQVAVTVRGQHAFHVDFTYCGSLFEGPTAAGVLNDTRRVGHTPLAFLISVPVGRVSRTFLRTGSLYVAVTKLACILGPTRLAAIQVPVPHLRITRVPIEGFHHIARVTAFGTLVHVITSLMAKGPGHWQVSRAPQCTCYFSGSSFDSRIAWDLRRAVHWPK